MGTILEITLVASDPARARESIERCFAEGERLEAVFTTWRESGELARQNRAAGGGPQPASPELLRILADAQGFTRATGGRFDVSVAPLVALWREAGARGALPGAEAVRAARARVGPERFAVDAARGTLALAEGAQLDLGGFAKGWTLDRLGELLRAEGIERAFLDFGGSSLLAMGTPLDAPHWRALVGDGGGDAVGVLGLREQSASISRSFGEALEIAGQRYGHILDPRSGWPAPGERLAIVVAPSGAAAEAWSKALVVEPGLVGSALPDDVDALALAERGPPAVSARWTRRVAWQARTP